MRIALVTTALSLALLAGCSGPKDSQANDAQANISTGSRTASTATGTTITAPTGQAVTGDEAKRVMKDRHETMEKIGKAMKAASREMKSDNPNLDTVRQSASAINDAAQHVGPLFPKGTGPDVGKTGAKPEIWANPQDFTAKLADFQKAAQAFNATAAGNDVAAIKKSFADLGNSCKACHDKYRSEMHH